MGAPNLKNQVSNSNPPKLDVGFIKTFVLATLQTLRVQCQFEAKAGKSFQKGNGQEIKANVAGIIGMTATSFKGSLAICFPEKTFLAIMGGMLGETYESMNDDLKDGAGELVNIIFGCAKKALSDAGHVIERAVPSVIHGSDVHLVHVASQPVLIIPFNSQGGAFQIEIVLE